MKIKPPFPYFGGKSSVAEIVWRSFGDCRNYVEPFAGSLAVLLARPHWPFAENRIETVNDKDCFLANFWRALQSDPETVSHYADWPVNEADLHARHLWLVNEGSKHVQRLRTEPDYYDAKIAGWWVWGCCQWIGSGWCHHPEWQQLPHLGGAGMGVHRPSQQLPHLGGGRGVHRPSQQLHDYLHMIAERLRRVRVCCGDWSRVCGPTPTVHMGLSAVFLDPPYADEANRKSNLYAQDSLTIAHEVRERAITHGDDKRLRIALCGYQNEHGEHMPANWECVHWKAKGGYASQSSRVNENSTQERIWFSPHCIREDRPQQADLWGDEQEKA